MAYMQQAQMPDQQFLWDVFQRCVRTFCALDFKCYRIVQKMRNL